ncbi:MAG: nicotinate phosphoribosyltransferase [Candidatus Kerfeldbacteria bacterium]
MRRKRTGQRIPDEALPLVTSGSRFMLASLYLNEGMRDTRATFDLFVRDLPDARNYLVFAGLERVIEFLTKLRFSSDQLRWIKRSFGFSPDVMAYWKQFHFNGDLWAMPEGSIFFPNEPVIRITAPLIEAQYVEMFIINAVYLQTILATKFSRFVHSANGKQVTLGFNRSYGTDAALQATRLSKVFGIQTSHVGYEYTHGGRTPFAIGTFHYLITSFKNERAAFRSYLRHTKGRGYVLVDTYDSIRGIRQYIEVARELSAIGMRPTGIQLDSGDILSLSRTARRMLDEAGLHDAKIFAMGNLDEYKVSALERARAPIDVYAGVTEILTPTDAPTLELVYKMVEVERSKRMVPVMKTSTKKQSFPGRKQVYRHTRSGQFIHDTLGLVGERVAGVPLLHPIIRSGHLVYQCPEPTEIGAYYQRERKKFDPQLFQINRRATYPVKISPRLSALTRATAAGIQRSVRKHDQASE